MSVTHLPLEEVAQINPPPENDQRPKAAACVGAAQVHPAVRDVRANSQADTTLRSHYGFLKPGDILLRKTLAKFAAGAVCELHTALPWAYHRGSLLSLRADPQRLDSRFLLHFLRSHQMAFLIDDWRTCQLMHGRKPPLSAFLRQLPVPLRPLAQQRELVAQLEQALAQCRHLEVQLVQLNQHRRWLFMDFFGAPAAMQDQYPAVLLPTLLYGYNTGTRLPACGDHGVRLVLPANLGVNRFCISDETRLPLPGKALSRGYPPIEPGDVLLDIRTTTVNTAVATAAMLPAAITKGMAMLRPEKVDAVYLAGYLASECATLAFKRLLKGRQIPKIKRRDLAGLPVYMPPVNMQKAYVTAINAPCPEIEATEREWWQCRQNLLKLELQAFGE